MPSFKTKTMSHLEADDFEYKLRAKGWVERPGATSSTLQPDEYTKRQGNINPHSFDGTPTVTFEVRES
jgi:hypothetical protein